jgi:hypothetical protein
MWIVRSCWRFGIYCNWIRDVVCVITLFGLEYFVGLVYMATRRNQYCHHRNCQESCGESAGRTYSERCPNRIYAIPKKNLFRAGVALKARRNCENWRRAEGVDLDRTKCECDLWKCNKFCYTHGYITKDEKMILDEIKQNNSCRVNSDCAKIQPQCPFGCCTYVNKKRAPYINYLINEYIRRSGCASCHYDCVPCQRNPDWGPICQEGKCRSLY